MLNPELLELFARKSLNKKLFFSTHNGRKQMSMALDGEAEGKPLQEAIGGSIARKTRRAPFGVWEWFYHGDELIAICKEIHPRLNWYQQQLVGRWIE